MRSSLRQRSASSSQESIVASKMKEAFMGNKGLTGLVREAPLEKVFELANVKKVRRQEVSATSHALN